MESNWRGVTLWGSDVLWRTARLEADLAYIASLGFNTVQLVINWSHIEPDINKPAFYSNRELRSIEQVLTWAEENSLYAFFGTRTSGREWTNLPPSWGWSYPDMFDPHYHSDWESWFNRFLDMWRYVINRFDHRSNVIGYNLDFFPWHGKDPETKSWTSPKRKVDHYEHVMTPRLLQMLREETDKIYFYTPMGQGSWRHPEAARVARLGFDAGEMPLDPTSSTGCYDYEYNRSMIDSGEPVNRPFDPADMGLIADGNVVYCSGGHRPINVEWRHSGDTGKPENWWGSPLQMEFLYWQFEPLKKFIRRYNVPAIITEMGAFYYNRPLPLPQWVADCYDAKMKIISQEPAINWIYWMFDNKNESILTEYGRYELNPIGEILVKYINGGDNGKMGSITNKRDHALTVTIPKKYLVDANATVEVPELADDIVIS